MKENQEKQFLINESLLVATVNYLGQQKHVEVDNLITALKNIPQVEVEEKPIDKNGD